ncbi:MAG: hypothetical protein DRI46_12625 [Chloroflexi bacterium]|nr:MAG: hypothetical protein DRI46_12625 [Chloroflexota bacterium]
MNGWTKFFADSTTCVGSDHAVAARTASWRNSRNHDMVAVELTCGTKKLHIDGPGIYWQSDGYEAVYPGPHTTLIKRRIEKRIDASDNYVRIRSTGDELNAVFNNALDGGKFVALGAKFVNKWLILELNVKDGTFSYCIKDKQV